MPQWTNAGTVSSLKSPDGPNRTSDVPTLVLWLGDHLGLPTNREGHQCPPVLDGQDNQ